MPKESSKKLSEVGFGFRLRGRIPCEGQGCPLCEAGHEAREAVVITAPENPAVDYYIFTKPFANRVKKENIKGDE